MTAGWSCDEGLKGACGSVRGALGGQKDEHAPEGKPGIVNELLGGGPVSVHEGRTEAGQVHPCPGIVEVDAAHHGPGLVRYHLLGIRPKYIACGAQVAIV